MAKIKKEERLATGISGFDKLTQGGFISDSLNLIIGNAGAGKTTFLLQFLYNGAAKYNEKGLYVSFESNKQNIYRNGLSLGMDFEELEKKGKCMILEFNPDESIKSLQEKLMRIVIENDIQRVGIDPLNVFSLNLPKEVSLRRQLYDFLSFIKNLNVCVLVAGESDEEFFGGGHKIADEIKFSKYLVDSVIELFSAGIGGEGDRALRISKMRMTNHFRGPVAFKITGKGISVSGNNSSKNTKSFVSGNTEKLVRKILSK